MARSIDKSQLPGKRGRCPYCGLTIPRTYDHYLPKEKYPELSVNPLNLVPCCNGCNSTKGARWIAGAGRLFVHFYSDVLPDSQFLFVRLRYLNGAVGAVFSLARPDGINDEVWNLIENHYRELKLLDEYRAQASEEVSGAYDRCYSHLESGGTDLAKFLRSESRRYARHFGVNHWRAVLAVGLAQISAFIEQVEADVVLNNI